jgi:hypothetical protein
MRKITVLVGILVLIHHLSFSQSLDKGNWIYRCNEKLVEVIMEDLFTPPVASRVQVYPNIAAYEVLCFKDKHMRPLAGQLTGLSRIDEPQQKVDLSLSACVAFTTVARKMVYSEYLINDFEQKEIQAWSLKNKDTSLLANSVAYGRKAADQIISWLKKDNYDYTRTLYRYSLADSASSWQPTSPDYANAIEPNWPLIRSLLFDSSTTVHVIPPLPYSENKNSAFYKSALNVYHQSQRADTLIHSIALFWDCNPNITRSAGHFMYFVHKISPAGHWLRIGGQAMKNLHLDESKCVQTYTLISLSLFEGFLACWKDKYMYNKIRPETYINKLIAPKWRPYIETPPFPEYPSGHSVVSGASSTILMGMIPQPYSFIDSSEMYISLPPRRFQSFKRAADEASISRFYGGIHFMEALDNGLDQGRRIGAYILSHVRVTQ